MNLKIGHKNIHNMQVIYDKDASYASGQSGKVIIGWVGGTDFVGLRGRAGAFATVVSSWPGHVW